LGKAILQVGTAVNFGRSQNIFKAKMAHPPRKNGPYAYASTPKTSGTYFVTEDMTASVILFTEWRLHNLHQIFSRCID